MKLALLLVVLSAFLGPVSSFAQIKTLSCKNFFQSPFLNLNDVSLDQAVSESGISKPHLEKMKEFSSGLTDIYELILSPPKQGVLLGVMNFFNLYSAIIEATGLTTWEDAYKKFGIETGESRHTDKFMRTLVNQEEPIVFLVPKNIWSHPGGVHTKRELWWLLENPEKMKNVVFVFGSIEIIDEKSFEDSLQTILQLRRTPELTQTPWEMQVKRLALSLRVHAKKFRSQTDLKDAQ